VSHHADEPIDQDPLFEFADEAEPRPQVSAADTATTQPAAAVDVAPPAQPDAPPAAPVDALSGRLDRLEHAHERELGQLSLLRSEVATLVAAIDDIKKREARRANYAAKLPALPAPTVRRSRTAAAVIGAVVGLAIGVLGWMKWQGDSIVSANDTPPAVVAEAPEPIDDPAPAAPPQPAIALASTVVPPAPREVSTRDIDQPQRDDATYVGTLSIDASPGGAVFINRKPAGQTPVRINNLKAGSHLVWIERDGYRRFTRVVQVPANRVSRVSAELERLTP
jgi:hypothetical protein